MGTKHVPRATLLQMLKRLEVKLIAASGAVVVEGKARKPKEMRVTVVDTARELYFDVEDTITHIQLLYCPRE